MIIDLPKEVENFVISEANKEQISHSEFIQKALAFLHTRGESKIIKMTYRANQTRQNENVKHGGSF